MKIVSESDHTEESLRTELEKLYVAAGYLHADSGRLALVMHLIAAAITELESLTEERTPPNLRLVHDAGRGQRPEA